MILGNILINSEGISAQIIKLQDFNNFHNVGSFSGQLFIEGYLAGLVKHGNSDYHRDRDSGVDGGGHTDDQYCDAAGYCLYRLPSQHQPGIPVFYDNI